VSTPPGWDGTGVDLASVGADHRHRGREVATMDRMDLPLLEDDLGSPAVIEPSEVLSPIDMPACVVLCFFSEVIDALAARDDTRVVQVLAAAHGTHTIWELEHAGERLAVMHPGVGAPLAAGFVEEVIALGGRAFVAVGGAGALLPDLVLGHAVVVDGAVRDEGTSLHYLAPSRTVDADPAAVAVVEDTLRTAGVPFVTGRTWTTDAIYRETRARVDRRVAEGCVTVEMEAAALIAVARYRGVRFAQLLYAGDSLAGPVWDARDWTAATTVRERLFWHAADAAVRLGAR
jgi:uridine phosphorylase